MKEIDYDFINHQADRYIDEIMENHLLNKQTADVMMSGFSSGYVQCLEDILDFKNVRYDNDIIGVINFEMLKCLFYNLKEKDVAQG